MKHLLLIIAVITFTSTINAQDSERILGTWLTQDGDSKVTIEKNGDGTYDGTIVWLKEPHRENGEEKKDDKNPDNNLQSRPIMGLKLLQGFSYDEDDEEWIDGTIYDPKSGSTYKCLMWFDDDPAT
jgi:uncharacterized protein (DUF2147 family)